MGGFVVDLDKRTLEGAPSYSDTDTVGWDDPTWGKRVYDYYGAHPYWDCRNASQTAAFGPPFLCQANVAKISSSALS